MPQLAANVFYLFSELPFLERFDAAAEMGFQAVEYPYPYQVPLVESQKHLDTNDLQVAFITAPVGDWQNGERGMAAIPGRESEFNASIEEAIKYSIALKCKNIHVMAGFIGCEISTMSAFKTFVANLNFATTLCGDNGLKVLIEPINNQEQPNYFVSNIEHALETIDRVDNDNIGLLYDTYHGVVNGEDLDRTLTAFIDKIAHIQVAGFPGRNEPSNGDIDYPTLFNKIDELGFRGWVGCEYNPQSETSAGLGWAKPYGIFASEPSIMQRGLANTGILKNDEEMT